jgi:MerR family mercuric resistance operon transcriptional regulator
MRDLKIGQAADAAGVNVAPSTVRCLRFIKDAQLIGFSLGEIAELLSLRARADASCGEVRDLAVQKRREVQDRLERLQRIASVLDELITDCPGNGDLRACSILEAIERAT